MFFSLAKIFEWLTIYKYLLLFPISVIEGPIITIIAGFLTAHGSLNFYITFVVVALGDIAGDTFYYAMGYFGRHKFLDHYGHYIGIKKDKLGYLEQHFYEHSGKTLIIGKVTQMAGGPVLIAAGAAKMPYWKFMGYNLISGLPKCLILLLIGFYFGQAYMQINSYFNLLAEIILAAIILLIAGYLIFKKTPS